MITKFNKYFIQVVLYVFIAFTVVSCGQQPQHHLSEVKKFNSGNTNVAKSSVSKNLIVVYKKTTSSQAILELEKLLPKFRKKSLSSKIFFVYDFLTLDNSIIAKKMLLASDIVKNVSNDRTFKIDRNFGYK
ncbi:hypothetical protein MNBD_GAMMA22-1168 [hydrothermal vent metagenome]|uniref:Uncharacterized protein n=1 Tax=hydrothermal vent metagenome TaxID=652676 RepID=A0A3B1A929_9ZZZZ